ncbi:MAG: hypothetical protein IH849_13005, partial [Acidobacteria bacterium]|nr:hypothetical protein [Acidobacteriota bacterium]
PPSASWREHVELSDRLAQADLAKLRGCGAVDRMLGADFATILPHDLLIKVDIATMAHGLEARSPFLDDELIDVVSRYPEPMKLPGFQTKRLLRELSRRYLPAPVQRSPKRGFEVPLVRWLRGELRGLCEDVILARDGLLAELFNRRALERLVRGQERLEPARWSPRRPVSGQPAQQAFLCRQRWARPALSGRRGGAVHGAVRRGRCRSDLRAQARVRAQHELVAGRSRSDRGLSCRRPARPLSRPRLVANRPHRSIPTCPLDRDRRARCRGG